MCVGTNDKMKDDYPQAYNMILGEALIESLQLTREFETAEPWALGLKLQEECGEFSEALLKELGYLTHKELKEPLMGEAADMIVVILATLVQLYPDKRLSDIARELRDQIIVKTIKYRNILENDNQ